MKKVFVTGGNGFVGSFLVNQLANSDYEVVSFDNNSSHNTQYIYHKNVQNIVGDIRNIDEVSSASAGCDVFFHLAASGNVVDSIQNPMLNFDNNVLGTINCLSVACQNNVSRFIFASTGGAIMGNSKPPVNEESVPSPLSPYGASKMACEGYCNAYSHSFGLHTTIFRFANVIGEFSAHKKGVINQFYKNLNKDEPIIIYGDPSRDFIYVGDIVDCLITASLADIEMGEVFHLCSGTETKIFDLAYAMIDICGNSNSKIEFNSHRKGEVEKTFASCEKAKKFLNFRCKFDFRTSLEKTIYWLNTYENNVKPN